MKRKQQAKWKRGLLSLALATTMVVPSAAMPAAAAQESRVEVSTTISHKTTSGDTNYFVFPQGQWEAGNDAHTWSKAPTAANPAATYYEVHFTGHKIEVFAGKNHPMGKVKYYIDNQEKGTYDLNNPTNIDSTHIATFDNLTEGEHTFRAEAVEAGKLIDAAEVVVYNYVEGFEDLHGSIVDTNLQYTQDKYGEILQKDVKEETLSAWKNDKAVSEISLISGNEALDNVTVTASDFVSGDNTIEKENVTTTFIKSVEAYTGMPGYGSTTRPVPTGSRKEANEVLYQETPIDMEANFVQNVWVDIDVPEDAEAGNYTGTISVTADGVEDPLTFTYTLKVADAVLPDAEDFKDGFDVELWQNPFAVADYYNVEAFSDDHFELLKSNMEIYKSIGGHAITTTIVDDAWDGQTYGKGQVKFPSMIEWIKKSNGTWEFDYSDFDAWVSFNKEMGLGDKIICYSIAPWNKKVTYTDEASGTRKTQGLEPGQTVYTEYWTAFLTDLIEHLEEKGWKDDTYIGIDERGFDVRAFDLIDKIKGKDGLPLKTAGAMDGFMEKQDLAMRVDDLNVGSVAIKAHPAEFENIRQRRENQGLRTTVYTCTGHKPGSFSLSAPGESYWTMMYSYSVGGEGFLKWSYDSWVEDPLRDTTHNAFEAGDCFFIFPDEKTAEEPKAKSSLRLEKLAEGVRDVNKLIVMKEEVPMMEPTIDSLMDTIKPNYAAGAYYLTEVGKSQLAADMTDVKEKISDLTEEYIKFQNGDNVVAEDAQVSYYSFDDGDAKDVWGERNGTVSNASFEDGKVGKAARVTSEKKITFPKNTTLTEKWSVSYWLYNESEMTNRVSVLTSDNGNLSFDVRISDSNASPGVHVQAGEGGFLTFKNAVIPSNEWVHLTWTTDKKDGLTLYVNGVKAESNTWTTTQNFTAPIDVLGGAGFEGMVDELKIYDRALTAGEVKLLSQVEGLNLAETSAQVKVGENYQIKATLVTGNPDKTITYTSMSPEIASVNDKGVVTGLKKGTAVIKVENAGGGYKAEVTIKVTKDLKIQYTIPQYELPDEYLSDIDKDAENLKGRKYLGQPDMVMLDDNKTLITAYPVGHGHGPLVMKVSTDAGETWTEKTDIPKSWADSLETPTMYKLNMTDGTTKLMLITGRPSWDNNTAGGWDTSISTDNGETWSEFKTHQSQLPNGEQNWSIVAMASLVQLHDENGKPIDKWMGVYHNYGYVNYRTYLTFDENGNDVWSTPEPYLSQYRDIESSHQICEVGMFRSPDGERIMALSRSQSHNHKSLMFYSDDEGKTWSRPEEVQGALQGERHKAVYDPISGRLLIVFREITLDYNQNGLIENNDWMAGDWVAWVGTYEDLLESNEGQYRILLDRDWANNAKSGDTGYTGIVVQPDGTYIMDSYGHWDKEVSQTSTDVRTDLCYIRQAKFSLGEIEQKFGLVDKSELQDAVEKWGNISAEGYTEESYAIYTEALAQAKEVLASKKVQQVEVDQAKEKLEEAAEGLDNIYEVTKEELNKVIKEAEGKKEADYTEESWKVFADALAKAKEAAEDEDAKQKDVDAAAEELAKAMDALVKAEEPKPPVEEADKEALNESIKAAEALKAEDYTEDSWKVFAEALEAAKKAAADEEATQEAVDAAADALVKAMDALEKVEDVPNPPVEELFEDVRKTDWYYDEVAWAYENGIMKGYDNVKAFGPVDTLKRAQFAQIMYNLADEPEVEFEDVLGDVREGDWYAEPVIWAYNEGIITGYEDSGLFGANDPITREQIATILYRYADKPAAENQDALKDFPDADKVSGFAKEAMLWAVEQGIITGDKGNLNPGGNANRAEVAAMMQRVIPVLEKK